MRAQQGPAVPGTPMGAKASLSWTAASAAAAARTKLRMMRLVDRRMWKPAPLCPPAKRIVSQPTNLTRQFKRSPTNVPELHAKRCRRSPRTEPLGRG